MYRLFVLLAAVACALGSAIQPRAPLPDGRIVGGEDAPIEMFPYQVSVRLLGSHICGGSLITDSVVLTAAHCILTSSATYYSIEFATATLSGYAVRGAARVLKHENYDSNTIDYDVALIFLKESVPFSDVAHNIDMASESPAPGTPAVVTGWGTTTEGGISSTTLQQVRVEIVDPAVCATQYEGVNDITDRMLCAGVNNGGKDACQGDSGGPLAADGLLVGIVSWGVGCARSDYAGVYTNVANLRPWIDSHLNDLTSK